MKWFTLLRRRIYLTRLFMVHQQNRRAIEGWQFEHAQRLIDHAKRNVPMYTKLYEHIDTDSITTLADMEKLPTMRKHMLIDRPVEEYIDSTSPARGYWHKTSGTSGHPLSLLKSAWARNRFYIDFTCYRFLVWDKVHSTALLNCKIARIDVRGKSQKNRLFLQMTAFRKDPEKAVRTLASYEPHLIASYTSVLLDIADVLEAHPDIVLRPRYAVVFGEMLSEAAREKIARALSCEVYNRYGMGEVGGAVGIECRLHDGMHVNSESVLLEIVDAEGTSVPDGEEGRVLVTDLLNYSMPFIRYEIGDRARVVRDACPCGLHTPRIWLEGRYSAYLTFGDRRIHHLEFDGALDGFMNTVLQYQIAKISDTKMLVRIVPGASFRTSNIARISESVAAIAGAGIEIGVGVVDQIARTPRGKSLIVVDESVQSE